MGSFLEIMAWSAAVDASDSARDAESAAREARDSSDELIGIQNRQARKTKIKMLNKFYQDIYHDRESEAYNLTSIREFANTQKNQLNRHQFPKMISYPSFPFSTTILIAFLSFLLYIGLFQIFIGIVIALILLNTWSNFKNWYYWRQSKNRENYDKNRLKMGKEKYFGVVKSLKQSYPGLSIYGWSAKYVVDVHIKDTYEYFKKENPSVAKESLLKFYELVLEIDIKEGHKSSMLKMFYEQAPEIFNLADSNSLFCIESLELYNTNSISSPSQKPRLPLCFR